MQGVNTLWEVRRPTLPYTSESQLSIGARMIVTTLNALKIQATLLLPPRAATMILA